MADLVFRGKLLFDKDNFGYLSVPTSLIDGLYSAAANNKVVPTGERGHIIAFTPDETSKIDKNSLQAKGKDFLFTIHGGNTKRTLTNGAYVTEYYIKCKCPDLKQLRLTLGLSAYPLGAELFMLPFAKSGRGIKF